MPMNKQQQTLRNTFLLLFILTGNWLGAQHQEIHEKPKIWRGKHNLTEDSGSLLHAFKSGTMEGHFRYFFSATDNGHGLSDYYAQAGGGGIRYESGSFHGFQFTVSGFFIFNIGSSDLGRRDPITGQLNRYEIGLFDIEDPHNRNDIDRLEELMLRYSRSKTHITYGKQLINTPFINLQDGRMRPTGVEGIWFDSRDIRNLKIEGGWLGAISPRSTVRWYDGGASIGVYPTGVNEDGKPSGYARNVESKGVALLGLEYRASNQWSLQGWNMLIDQVSNTSLFQTNYQHQTRKDWIVGVSGQAIAQYAIGNGGNEDQQKTYMTRGSRAYTFGARLSVKEGPWEHSLNYNRITSHGRYLMPREWGRDPFFTFMPRERNEGYGNLHAFVARSSYAKKGSNWRSSLAAGYFNLPDVYNYRLNKYGMPSYYQANADLRYSFKTGLLQGLDAQLLVVAKMNAGDVPENLRFVFNKTDMVLYNFILNYHF
jgi:hypothetical protein